MILLVLLIFSVIFGFFFGVFWASARIQRQPNRDDCFNRIAEITDSQAIDEHLIATFARRPCMNLPPLPSCPEAFAENSEKWCYPCLARLELSRIESVPLAGCPAIEGDQP